MTPDQDTIATLRAALERARAERDLLQAEHERVLTMWRAETEALRRSEEQFRLLVEAVVDYAIIMITPYGKIASWNRGAERIKGYTEADIIGKPYETFFLPDDVEAGKPQRLLRLALQHGHHEDEGWRKRKDGTTFWADAVITAVRDNTGRLVGFAKITRDLTEKKQGEAIASQNARLAEANRLKSMFLANMSHELRTPLNSIIGYTDLVLSDTEQPLNDINRGNLETVVRNGRHLLSLIGDVLDIAKIEAGKMTVFAETIDLCALVASMLETTEPLARTKQLRLTANCDPTIGLITQDQTKVRQILLNLISNAVKFTHEGVVTVTASPYGIDRFAVRVEDTGIGIAPEHQQLVFEEFRQVDGSTTRQAGGTGLGLAIAFRMARLLGGELSLESTLGQGSIFTLVLPRHYQEPSFEATAELTETRG